MNHHPLMKTHEVLTNMVGRLFPTTSSCHRFPWPQWWQWGDGFWDTEVAVTSWGPWLWMAVNRGWNPTELFRDYVISHEIRIRNLFTKQDFMVIMSGLNVAKLVAPHNRVIDISRSRRAQVGTEIFSKILGGDLFKVMFLGDFFLP